LGGEWREEQFLSGDIGTMQVAVFKDGTMLWNASDAGVFDLNTTLVAGDTLDFDVYGGYGYGNTGLELAITTVPEPSSMACLLAGGFLLLARRVRRSLSQAAAKRLPVQAVYDPGR